MPKVFILILKPKITMNGSESESPVNSFVSNEYCLFMTVKVS